jgi:hypothetical protein
LLKASRLSSLLGANAEFDRFASGASRARGMAAQIAVPEEALFVKESSAKPKSVLPGVVEDRTVNGAREKSAPLLTGG